MNLKTAAKSTETFLMRMERLSSSQVAPCKSSSFVSAHSTLFSHTRPHFHFCTLTLSYLSLVLRTSPHNRFSILIYAYPFCFDQNKGQQFVPACYSRRCDPTTAMKSSLVSWIFLALRTRMFHSIKGPHDYGRKPHRLDELAMVNYTKGSANRNSSYS
jgi:hypothetical protein